MSSSRRRRPSSRGSPDEEDNAHNEDSDEDQVDDGQEEEDYTPNRNPATRAKVATTRRSATKSKQTASTASGQKRTRNSKSATGSNNGDDNRKKAKKTKRGQRSNVSSAAADDDDEEEDEEEAEQLDEGLEGVEEDDENEGIYDDENNPLPTSYHKLFHLTLAQRAPAYDTLINMIRKDPYFEIDENLGEDTIRLKCRKALNKWIRSMNRALEPAGLGFASLVDPDIEDRKHITLKNLVNDELVWNEKGARNTGFEGRELRALKELLNEIRESEDYLVSSKSAEKIVKKECPDPKKMLQRFCEECWIQDEDGKYGWGVRAKTINITPLE